MRTPATKTAYVLLTDRVGYSQVPIEEKTVLDRELLEAVQQCPAVMGLSEDDLLRLDTGDGIALVFFTDPIAAVEAALYLFERVAKGASTKLRIGLHSGLVLRRTDANGKPNVSGPGIEKAQRAMSCADGSQVVMTEFFAENLRAFATWGERLEDLGEHAIKHGEMLQLYGIGGIPSFEPAEPKVAIIYRRKTSPDDAILDMLESKLGDAKLRVFIDRHLSVGVQWAQQIEREIRSADAVVVLVSDAAAASEMVLFELETAIDQREKGDKPRILPIRIGKDEPAPGEVGSLLAPFHYIHWGSREDDDTVADAIVRALTAKPDRVSGHLERVGGAMPPDSPYYVTRTTDDEFVKALLERDSIVLVKGARQIGKTSLMARSLRIAAESGSKIVWTDLQSFGSSQLQSDDRLYMAFAVSIASQLELDVDVMESWRPVLGANANFERFLQNHVLKKIEGPVIWALDEVDRLFTVPHSSDFFGMVRSWHNRRATSLDSVWSRLTVAMAYATEAHLFVSDLNQSPFNVGTRLELEDFDTAQIADINRRYGEPVKNQADLFQIKVLLGGQPYLTRRIFDEMVRHGESLAELEREGALDEGPFGDHLRRLLIALSSDARLLEEVRLMLGGGAPRTEEAFYRLRSGGLVKGGHRGEAQFRCEIYAQYLRRHLS